MPFLPTDRLLREPLAVLLVACIYAWNTLTHYPAVAQVDLASLVFEGLLAVLPAAGMFLVRHLHDDTRQAYRHLLIGLAALTISMVTDTLDEVVDMPDMYNFVFEGLFQVVGFALVLLGLRRWIDYNETLKAQLCELATTDFLTGAANRRHFVATLTTELERALRHHNPLSVIFLDVDHFKQVNDVFGHEAGDRVLIGAAQVVREQLRKTDVFARYGGEEFAILLPQTSLEGAYALAEKCRHVLQEKSFPDSGAVTASFGVATYDHLETADQLLKRVDQSLYEAKAAGRNRVVSQAS